MRALVTGAANGIGRATAEILAGEGAEIVAVDRDDPGTGWTWHAADLSDPASIDAVPLDGAFDAVVNAAGLPPRDGAEAAVLSVNFLGLRRLALRAIPLMANCGAMVSIASKAGAHWRENADQARRLIALDDPADLPGFVADEGIGKVSAYDLSKEAVILWTKALTMDFVARGLRANTVSPAAIDTRILGDFVDAFGARATDAMALTRRAGTAREAAEVAAFLARPASSWIKGQDIAVDGGLAAMRDAETFGLA